MISLQTLRADGSILSYYGDGVCLSTDDKPTGNVENGTKLLEMDTGKVWIYDSENTQWRQFV